MDMDIISRDYSGENWTMKMGSDGELKHLCPKLAHSDIMKTLLSTFWIDIIIVVNCLAASYSIELCAVKLVTVAWWCSG